MYTNSAHTCINLKPNLKLGNHSVQISKNIEQSLINSVCQIKNFLTTTLALFVILGHNHEVVPLHEVTESMRSNLRKLSQCIYDKIKRSRNTEKSTWKRLSALEDHVETIYRRIDAIGDDLVQKQYLCTFTCINRRVRQLLLLILSFFAMFIKRISSSKYKF